MGLSLPERGDWEHVKVDVKSFGGSVDSRLAHSSVEYHHPKGEHMRYLMMINTPEIEDTKLTEAEAGARFGEYGKWMEEAAAGGHLLGGERLHPTTTATTVRVRNGETLTTDGPFAETTEQIGGYYLMDCKDIDQAIELAAKLPGANHGSVEVRPIWEM
jgi:hypothetical protein